MTLRSKKLEKIYQDYLKNDYDYKCIFCSRDMIIEEFNHWILLKNKFPYNKVFKNHCLLSPKAHIKEFKDLYKDEITELNELLEELDYDMCILNKKKKRSVPEHFHYHLVKIK